MNNVKISLDSHKRYDNLGQDEIDIDYIKKGA